MGFSTDFSHKKWRNLPSRCRMSLSSAKGAVQTLWGQKKNEKWAPVQKGPGTKPTFFFVKKRCVFFLIASFYFFRGSRTSEGQLLLLGKGGLNTPITRHIYQLNEVMRSTKSICPFASCRGLSWFFHQPTAENNGGLFAKFPTVLCWNIDVRH